MRLITYSIVTLLSVIIFVIGCTKETINKTCENFVMPKQTVLDFDNDGTTDFIISYEALTWDGYNTWGNSINGLLKSQNDNEILFSGSSDKFFYKLNDTIKETPKMPQYWENFPLFFLHIWLIFLQIIVIFHALFRIPGVVF